MHCFTNVIQLFFHQILTFYHFSTLHVYKPESCVNNKSSSMESLPILTHDYVLVNPPYKPIQVNVSVAQYVFEQIKKFGNSPALVRILFYFLQNSD